jgi:hypothetical protein
MIHYSHRVTACLWYYPGTGVCKTTMAGVLSVRLMSPEQSTWDWGLQNLPTSLLKLLGGRGLARSVHTSFIEPGIVSQV